MLAINESIVQNQLEQRQIDFALVTPDFQAPDIHAKNLYDERYICAVRHDHPIAQQSQLTLEQFCQLEQALISYHGGSFSGVTDKALQAMGLQRNVSLSVQNFIQGFTKTLIWHERTHKDPAYRWVRELIEKACATSLV